MNIIIWQNVVRPKPDQLARFAILVAAQHSLPKGINELKMDDIQKLIIMWQATTNPLTPHGEEGGWFGNFVRDTLPIAGAPEWASSKLNLLPLLCSSSQCPAMGWCPTLG